MAGGAEQGEDSLYNIEARCRVHVELMKPQTSELSAGQRDGRKAAGWK